MFVAIIIIAVVSGKELIAIIRGMVSHFARNLGNKANLQVVMVN